MQVWLSRLLTTITLLIALQVPFGAPALSEQPPDAADFTRAMARDLNQLGIPNPAEVASSLTLHSKTKTGSDAQISLDRIFLACRTNPSNCSDLRSKFLLAVQESLKAEIAPVTNSTLRAVLRPVTYFRSNLAAVHAVRIPSTTLPESLVALIYADQSRSMRTVGDQDLQRLKLSAAQASSLALHNTAVALTPFRDAIQAAPDGQIRQLAGDSYESSRMILHSDWAEASQRFHGHLIVSVPSAEELLYADGSTAQSVARLAAITHAHFASAQRPISPSVMEWHPDRWVVVAP